MGFSTILLITNYILHYNIIIYPDIRQDLILHASSLGIGFLEFNIIYKGSKKCILFIKNRLNNNQDNLLDIEN